MTNECRRGLIWCWVRLSPTFTSRPRPHIWFFFVNNFFFCVLWFGFDLIRVDETKKKKSLFLFFDYFVMNFSLIFKKLINFQVYWFKINQKKLKAKSRSSVENEPQGKVAEGSSMNRVGREEIGSQSLQKIRGPIDWVTLFTDDTQMCDQTAKQTFYRIASPSPLGLRGNASEREGKFNFAVENNVGETKNGFWGTFRGTRLRIWPEAAALGQKSQDKTLKIL